MMGMKKEGKKDLFEGKMPKKMEKVTVEGADLAKETSCSFPFLEFLKKLKK